MKDLIDALRTQLALGPVSRFKGYEVPPEAREAAKSDFRVLWGTINTYAPQSKAFPNNIKPKE